MILVDSSVWIRALRSGDSTEAAELRSLLEQDEVAITEVVLAEVLQGARSQEDFELLLNRMDGLHLFPAGRDAWIEAAQRSFELRSKGLVTPLADLVVAVVARDNDLAVYALDDHFTRVDALRLHKPELPERM